MKRLEMLKRAVQRARDAIDENAVLSDEDYDRLRLLHDDEKAVALLAFSILREAADAEGD